MNIVKIDPHVEILDCDNCIAISLIINFYVNDLYIGQRMLSGDFEQIDGITYYGIQRACGTKLTLDEILEFFDDVGTSIGANQMLDHSDCTFKHIEFNYSNGNDTFSFENGKLMISFSTLVQGIEAISFNFDTQKSDIVGLSKLKNKFEEFSKTYLRLQK